MKRMFILAGANGSGKSTISRVLLPAEGIVYVNPDDIAMELNPSDPLGVRIEAGRETFRRIDELFERGESFAVESTLSGNAYVKVLQLAKALGYETMIAYVFVDSPEVCIARIAVRVQGGGHFVPDEDVRRRYARSKENFAKNAMRRLWRVYAGISRANDKDSKHCRSCCTRRKQAQGYCECLCTQRQDRLAASRWYDRHDSAAIVRRRTDGAET